MKKINVRKLMLFLFIAILVASISTISFAALPDISPTYGVGAVKIKGVASIVLGIIQVIAVAAATIMLVVMAIKYISAAPSEKAEIKKGMFVYVIGALLLFAGAGILNVIKAFAVDINGVTGAVGSTSIVRMV